MNILKALAASLLLTPFTFSQNVKEPVPRPAGAYVLSVTADKPGIEGLICDSTKVGPDLWDIVAVVKARDHGPFKLSDEVNKPEFSYIYPEMSAAIKSTNSLFIEVTDGQTTEKVSLGGPGLDVVNHYLEFTRGRHISLGKFGWAQVWLTVKAGSKQIDVVLNWHSARWGNKALGDVIFKSAKIIVPDGVVWKMNLNDKVADVEQGYLVKPYPSATGFHVIPKQGERPFRFSVFLEDAAYKAPWTQIGVSDGLVPVWRTKPYAPTIPLSSSQSTAALDEIWLGNLENRWVERTGSSESSTATPYSYLWPGRRAHYGGETGGQDMYPMDGVRWYASSQVSIIESGMIEQLRFRSRHRGALVNALGYPVRPEELPGQGANYPGTSDWRMYNSELMRAGPFKFPPRRITPGTGPELFSSIDCQHLVREQNHNWMLAYAGDHLARHYIEMEAAKSVLTFWPGTGQARNWPAVVPGKGTSLGRAEAWAAITIAHALAYGAPIERYAPFIETYVGILEQAQMPSGLFQVNPNAKEAKNPPFCTGGTGVGDGTPIYQIGSGLEECYHVAALYALMPYDSRGPARIENMLTKHAIGMENLAWKPGASGVYSHTARGPINSSVRYVTREDWPTTLKQDMVRGCPTCPYNDGFHTLYALGCYQHSGVSIPTLFNWGTGAQDPKTWGLVRNGVPLEQWWILASSN